MGITTFTHGDKQYYRVTKYINGTDNQEYIPIKNNTVTEKKKALSKAKDVEHKLDQQHKSSSLLKNLSTENLIKEDGAIINISRFKRKRNNRAEEEEFRVYLQDKAAGKQKLRTVSIKKHGEVEAFKQAVRLFSDHRNIDPDGDVIKQLLNQAHAYGIGDIPELLPTEEELNHFTTEWEESFKEEMGKFITPAKPARKKTKRSR